MKKWIVLFLFLFAFASFAWGADTKITGLDADTAPTSDDLTITVDAPGTSPVNKKVTLGNLPKAWGGSYHVCKTVTNPSDSDLLLFDIPNHAFTATKVIGIAVGGTSAVVDIQECATDGTSCANIQTASLTVDTDGANTTSFGDAAIAASAILKLDIGTVTGVVTQVIVCLEGN